MAKTNPYLRIIQGGMSSPPPAPYPNPPTPNDFAGDIVRMGTKIAEDGKGGKLIRAFGRLYHVQFDLNEVPIDWYLIEVGAHGACHYCGSPTDNTPSSIEITDELSKWHYCDPADVVVLDRPVCDECKKIGDEIDTLLQGCVQ